MSTFERHGISFFASMIDPNISYLPTMRWFLLATQRMNIEFDIFNVPGNSSPKNLETAILIYACKTGVGAID